MKPGDFICLAIALNCSTASVLSQPSTVGNGSSIAPSAGQLENYGINGLQPNGTSSAFPTRHRRLQGTGIGGSFIGTTSPTSESTPATKLVTYPPMQATTAQFRLPKLDSTFPEINNTALQSFNPALPVLPHVNALSSPVNRSNSFDSTSSNLGLETMSSFNNRQSVTDQMQFDSSNSFR